MKRMFRSKLRFVFIPIFVAAFVFFVGFAVMYLWNFTLPVIFDVQTINLWQAIALFILCKILFGFGKGGAKRGGPWMRQSMRKRFEGLSDEEKDRMKAYMRSRWCSWDDPTVTTDTNDFVANNKTDK
ncbi:hypothetical protein [Olivibacter ginsenosidimutans]